MKSNKMKENAKIFHDEKSRPEIKLEKSITIEQKINEKVVKIIITIEKKKWKS